MDFNRFPWLGLFSWVFLILCLKAHGGDSDIPVRFLKAPLPISSVTSPTFVFEVLEDGNRGFCRNCSIDCKLDDLISSSCEAREASYVALLDGEHTFEVCVNGSRGVRCGSYNWTVDTVPPTAYVTAATSFTNALNVSVDISFSEPCSGGGGFRCSSVNACNLLVYGAGQVIPSTLNILQPELKFSLLVGLSPSVQYGRVVLVMDKSFCTDTAGNGFTRTTNSSFLLHFDRRSVFVNMSAHIPEKLLQINSETRMVEATNNDKNLSIDLYFSKPVLNSSAEILTVRHASNGVLPTNGKNPGNHRFGFLVKNLSNIAVVTVNIETSRIISRKGIPVSPTNPITFLYDSKRPTVSLSTTFNMRTREKRVPVLIKFVKPVFDFNSSFILISGGHLQSFNEISRSIYTVDIHADDSIISVNIPENITGDVAGNRNLASNTLQVRHYSVPIVSSVFSTAATAAFAVTSLAAGLLTISTATLQSSHALSRRSYLTSDPSRNLFRIASHIQIFALSKWLAVTIPIEYYEFARGLQWSIPYLGLPWETGHTHSFMVDSGSPIMTHSKIYEKHGSGNSKISRVRDGKLEIDASISGLPLTAMEYSSFFENQNIKPEAEFIRDSQNSKGWNEFTQNMFWLAVIGGGSILLHALLLFNLKLRRKNSEKQRCYGALVLPRFEIFLILLALPSTCQASAVLIRGGSTSGVVVGILLLGVSSSLLLSLLVFLSIGITLGKLLQYKEVHQEGQKFHWYQDIVRVILGPGKKGQWTWKNQPNSVRLTMLGPLFEDLRGPPKYMLSQIARKDPREHGDRIIASDDETEDAEAPFIQKLFGILRIYYTLLESMKRVALGIVAGSGNGSSKILALFMLCITSFQLFFLVLKKPFIKKKVQLVEIVSVTGEVVIFAMCMVLLEKKFSVTDEKRVGVFMILVFMIVFLMQMINEWYALYRQILRLAPVDNSSLGSGFKTACIGLLLVFIPSKLLKNLGYSLNGETEDSGSRGHRSRSSESRSSGERPWLKQLRELAKASFSRDDDGSSNDPSSSQNPTSGIWSGKRSGSPSVTSSVDFKSRSKGLNGDLEAIFSSK